MDEKEFNKKYEEGVYFKIKINKDLNLKEVLRELVKGISTIPLYGGNLNEDLEYEVLLIFEMKSMKIDKYTNEIRINK